MSYSEAGSADTGLFVFESDAMVQQFRLQINVVWQFPVS